jgi:hypothetical protein
MSERIIIQPEQHEARIDAPEKLEALPTAAQAEALRPGEKDPTVRLEQARQSVEQNVDDDNPFKKMEAAEKASNAPTPSHVNRELKAITLKRELKQIRHKLSSPEKSLSKVIHQPTVRAISEATAKSIERPSGLLGGGIMAFVGSLGYLYLAKHIGFTYNYAVFFVFLIGGFAIGIILELLVWTFTKHRSLDV